MHKDDGPHDALEADQDHTPPIEPTKDELIDPQVAKEINKIQQQSTAEIDAPVHDEVDTDIHVTNGAIRTGETESEHIAPDVPSSAPDSQNELREEKNEAPDRKNEQPTSQHIEQVEKTSVQSEKLSEPRPSKETCNNNDSHSKNDNHGKNIIIIKRVKKVVHGHHGGAWKIAYADFITAMMAFFLLMWLLSMLNKYQLEGMAEYFRRPLKDAIAQKSDSKHDKVKTQESSTTDKLVKDEAKKTDEVKPAVSKEEAAKLQAKKQSEAIRNDLMKQLQSNPEISQYKNMLNFKVTSQGLKIEMKDIENQPMFSSGKTDFAEYASTVLSWLSEAMNQYPNRVMIVGHTDSRPIQGDDSYTNWELSADRANATRRELINHGMANEKVVRIVGMADVDKLETAATSYDPSNRRIEIVVLSDDAFDKMLKE
mgnify:CR=1 FL=1